MHSFNSVNWTTSKQARLHKRNMNAGSEMLHNFQTSTSSYTGSSVLTCCANYYPPKLLFCPVDFVFAACRPSNAETDAVHNPLFANQRLKKLFSAGCHNALISWQRISLAWLESPFWLKTHHYMDPSIRITTKSNAGRITQQEYHLRQQSVTSFSKQRAMER